MCRGKVRLRACERIAMILVDTSVWIDFFRTRTETVHPLAVLLSERNRVCICGLVRQEILQGVRRAKSLTSTKRLLSYLPFLPTSEAMYDRAAEIFQRAARSGLTIPTVDATIAAIALEHRVELYTNDHRHLQPVAKMIALPLYEPLQQ